MNVTYCMYMIALILDASLLLSFINKDYKYQFHRQIYTDSDYPFGIFKPFLI